jgi:hypothetical protein
MLKPLSLIMTLAGILFLVVLLNFTSPIQINSEKELSSLQSNQKVLVYGRIISERTYDNLKILKLDNNITLVCSSCPSIKNQTLSILGTIQVYNNETEIKILKISKYD